MTFRLQASVVSCSEALRQQETNFRALKCLLTESYLLQFAVDSSKGVLACVSMHVKMYGTTAEHICQVHF